MPILSVKNLTHTYSPDTPFRRVAVDDVSFDIEQGEFIGVIGHTGSGKSTLMQHLNGLLKPTSGQILYDGQDIHAKGYKLSQLRFQVGMVFQYPEYQLFEETVRADIAFGPKNMGLSEAEIAERVVRAAAFCGLKEEYLDRSPFELSGGQKRRAAIAGVIAMEPRVLILDEPAAGLDPRGRNKILGQIREFHRQTGCTVLLVSHSMEDIAEYCRKVLAMQKGRIFAFDTAERVFARADELKKTGLDIPEVTKVLLNMREEGVGTDTATYTLQAAHEQIMGLYKAGGTHA